MNTPGEWKDEVRSWSRRLKSPLPIKEEGIVLFFERAFENTQVPDKAWFGVHKSRASLVVGGIFLAAVMRSGEEQGVWLLLDQEPPEIEGIQYRPVKSTRSSPSPLIWAHSSHFASTTTLAENDDIWAWYQRATIRIFDFPRIAADRDSLQGERRKQRLSEIYNWEIEAEGVYPDEVDEQAVYKEGAVQRVAVNAYERNRKARRACIKKYKAQCWICKFNFERKYGARAKGLIHVHHLRPLSEVGDEYEINVDDLRPVCPNCHAVIHSRIPAYSIEEVAQMITDATDGT
jgi:hypothetical protein